MSTLPPPRTLITNLFSTIPSPSTPSTSSNPLKDAPPSTKPLLLTLHVLFPNELLPALDLLDRRLVTRFLIKEGDGIAEQRLPEPAPDQLDSTTVPTSDTKAPSIYFIRSAQSSSNPRFSAPLTSHYEVRPLAWNCSCPAFAFSAFPTDLYSRPVSPINPSNDLARDDWNFGGLSEGPGVCKHLLACVLVERAPGFFGSCVEERKIGKEELAGLCAGWGG